MFTSYSKKQKTGCAIIEVYKNTLPFFDIGMGWIVPSIIGLIIGVIISLIKKD